MMELLPESITLIQICTVAICSVFAVFVLVRALGTSRESAVYPPGPPQDPLIGNLRNFPSSNFYDVFCEWQKLYGDIVYVRLPGIPMMIINSLDVAHELLSKRANVNSGRTVGYMFNDLMDWKWGLPLRQADKNHQEMRKMLRRGIGPQRIGSHDELLEVCAKELILNFRIAKGDPIPLITNTTGRMVIQIAYGDKIWNTIGTELVGLNKEAVGFIEENLHKFWFVDIFHFLRFIPSWMPGAEFQRLAKQSRDCSGKIKSLPWEHIIELHKTGTPGCSLGADLLDEYGPSENVRDVLAVLYTAGVDSTTSVITRFLHAMFLFPKIAQKVYDEITSCTGKERLPTVPDRSNLPYTEAVWKETLRWRPFAPIVMPHTSQDDQTLNGYFIPKGTLIQPNIGFMLTDPATWGDPDVFRPERFLLDHNPTANDLPDPSYLVFGFGTRICPGIYLADRAGFYIASTTIALYEVLPLEGKKVPDPDTVQYGVDLIRHPKGFACRFVPRGQQAENLLLSISLDGNN